MPESATSIQSRTIVHSTSMGSNPISATTYTKKALLGTQVVSVKVEPPMSLVNGDSSKLTAATRLVQLVAPSGATVLTADRQVSAPNILKRAKSAATTITLAPKRPMLSTTYVTTLPSPPSSTSSVNSETQEQPQQAPTTTSNSHGQQQGQNNSADFDKSPLSLLAEEAARRTPTLNLPPCATADVPLDPKFIGGPIIAGKEQIDIRKSEIVCQQISEHKLSGPYVLLIAHSHREYRGTMIKAENFEGFKEDLEAMKRWPLRAWTDSAYLETQYVLLDIPKLGTHPVAIVTLKDENVVNLRFPVLSSDRNNHGHKKFGRLWEQIIFPYDRLKTAYAHWHITPIQVVAELRDPNKLKKPKRPDLIQQPLALNLQYRHNAADFSEGSPGGYVTYGENSDDESVDSKSRLGLEFKVKQEPTESFEQTNVNALCSPEDMSKDQLISVIMGNYRKKCEMLQNATPEFLRYVYRSSISDLNNLGHHIEAENMALLRTKSLVNNFENGI